jgi:hypothetical protein
VNRAQPGNPDFMLIKSGLCGRVEQVVVEPAELARRW